MRTIVDLHMHSYYSRATSKRLTVVGIGTFAAMKGVNVIATGDITHPKWLEEIQRDLEEDGSGFLRHKTDRSAARYALFGEVASIYKKDGIARRVHTLFGVSSIAAAQQVNAVLERRGFNIRYDGRPIIGLDVQELAKIYLEADPQALIIPAHIWTPWFALFGSKSGFDSIKDCFGDLAPQIFAIETGLSSDPDMNARVSDLNNVAIISNSDAHSPQNIGREATVFDWEAVNYQALYDSLKHNRIEYTIEFYPEEGKYHLDGHRSCGIRWTPAQTAQHHGRCSVCGLPVVVGVMNRVAALADQAVSDRPIPAQFKSIVPLPEIIANCFGLKSVTSKRVQAEFERLIASIGNEFHILLDASESELDAVADPLVAEGIKRVRRGALHIEPGYDSVFGTVQVFTPVERLSWSSQQQSFI